MGTIVNIVIVCIGVAAVALLICAKIKEARGHSGCSGNCANCSGCTPQKHKQQK